MPQPPPSTIYGAISVGLLIAVMGLVFAAFTLLAEGPPRITVLLLLGATVIAWGLTRIVCDQWRFLLLLISGLSALSAVLVTAIPTAIFPTPSAQERVDEYYAECRTLGKKCVVEMQQVIATGSEELTALGVNLISEDGMGFSEGSAVVVVSTSAGIRWKSPLQSFRPGFGLIDLQTDVTNNLFALFAITNHSTMAWVIRLEGPAVTDFGTMGGATLPVDGYTEPDYHGLRSLYTWREGWPANSLNPTTSRDAFRWTGQAYKFAGCQHINLSKEPGTSGEVTSTFEPGTRQCRAPVGKYSVDLPGDRHPSSPLP